VKGLSWGCSTEMKEAMRDPTSRISDQWGVGQWQEGVRMTLKWGADSPS
jgi:hypothetical protein